MSDAIREQQTGDVLSSIRRLVSQEAEGGRLAPLVLTPALRVLPDPGPAPVTEAPPASLEQTIAKLESTIAPSHDDWQQDVPGRIPPRAEKPAAPEQPARADNLFRPEPSNINDEDLRRLVAELVRDELQAAVGEVVTRKIRRLVRKEIDIALDDRDL